MNGEAKRIMALLTEDDYNGVSLKLKNGICVLLRSRVIPNNVIIQNLPGRVNYCKVTHEFMNGENYESLGIWVF